MNKNIIKLTSTILMLSATAAFSGGYYPADPVDAPPVQTGFPTGWYLSLNGGITAINSITKNNHKHSGFFNGAGSAYGGFQYDEHWAAELGAGYYSMGSFGKFGIADFAVKASMPMTSFSTVFVKFGAAYVALKACDGGCQTQTRGAPFLGGGFGVLLRYDMMATVEYDAAYVPSGLADGVLGAVTGGLTFYFD